LQTPFEQTVPPWHGAPWDVVQSPLAPQNELFVLGSMQLLPGPPSGFGQSSRPVVHVCTQPPSWQTVTPWVHVCPGLPASPLFVQVPEAPQYVLSVCGMMQVPLHATCPAMHEIAQPPSVHFSPLGQVCPSLTMPVQSPCAPQNWLSDVGSTQWLVGVGQMICPIGHETAQPPSRHTGVADPGVQTVPTKPPSLPQLPVAPQKLLLLFGSMHTAMFGGPQGTWPGEQLGSHTPFVQTYSGGHFWPCSRSWQSPEAPQWVRSVFGSMHVLPHLRSGATHVIEHLPAEQTSPGGQVAPWLATPTHGACAPQ
jgi:hypothetical protein